MSRPENVSTKSDEDHDLLEIGLAGEPAGLVAGIGERAVDHDVKLPGLPGLDVDRATAARLEHGERRPAAQGREQPPALASGELPESWLGTVGTALVVVARHEVAAFPYEEV